MPHTDQELEALATLLHDLPIENDGMNVAELDGFVAGLHVCPEMMMPSEWLPVVWGDNVEASFRDKDQAAATLNAVMDHYNRIAKLLATSPDDYQALFGVDPNSDETLWEPWISGFERAMRLRPDSWEDIVDSDDDEAASSISMIVALHEIDQGTSELTEQAIDELDEIAPSFIADIVITLNEGTKARMQNPVEEFEAANSNVAPFRSTKVGRNDPCPCGSGKKHKKCCG